MGGVSVGVWRALRDVRATHMLYVALNSINRMFTWRCGRGECGRGECGGVWRAWHAVGVTQMLISLDQQRQDGKV